MRLRLIREWRLSHHHLIQYLTSRCRILTASSDSSSLYKEQLALVLVQAQTQPPQASGI